MVYKTVLPKMLTMRTKPTKGAEQNDERAQLEVLHVDEHGCGNGVHAADNHHLEENLWNSRDYCQLREFTLFCENDGPESEWLLDRTFSNNNTQNVR